MKEDMPGGNLRVFRPVSFVSQVAGKGGGARWRVERRWCQGMSHVKWKIWKMSLLKCGKCEGGRISKAGGSQVTMCCYRYNPPLEVEGPLPPHELIRLARCGQVSSCGFIFQPSSNMLLCSSFWSKWSKRCHQPTFWWWISIKGLTFASKHQQHRLSVNKNILPQFQNKAMENK